MNALAFIVGNANYEGEHNKLINAINDANDFAAKLLNLGFVVMKSTDCTNESFDRDGKFTHICPLPSTLK